MQQSGVSKFGLIAVFSTLAIVMLITGVALFSFFVEFDEPVQANPINSPSINAIRLEDIDPALALISLAGSSNINVIDQAVNKARPGTGLATIIYTPNLNAGEVVGNLLLLGGKFALNGDMDRALVCYRMAGSLASLSPDLPDTLRADVFLQVGDAVTVLGQPVLAKIYLDQAFLIATESKYLQPAYRRSILEQLQGDYLKIGLNDLAKQSAQLSLEPTNLTPLPETPLALPLAKEVPLPTEVQEAEAARWRAAQAVVRDLVELGGVVKPERLEALQAALLKEDEVKTVFYAQALETEQKTSGKVDLMQAQINWQSIKYRVALLGYGRSLVPAWEAQVDELKMALISSYQEQNRLYNDLIVAMPDASQIDRAIEEALRRQILAGELGHYPDYPAEQLRNQLLNATARLIETQPGTRLRVSFLTIDGTNFYTLISDAKIVQN